MKFVYVILGAAIGASARYVLSGWISSATTGDFPWGTLAVNLLGCLIIGVAWGVGEHGDWSIGLRTFLFVGILGSFTTFSSFGLETLSLIRGGGWVYALAYVSASNIVGLCLVWAGFSAGHTIAG